MLMTATGMEGVKRAREIVANSRDLVDVCANSAKLMTGLFRLGVIPTIAPFLLSAFPPVLSERYPDPDPQLALREDLTANLLVESLLDDALGGRGAEDCTRITVG